MQRYHDTSADPLPLKSTHLDAERERIEQATAEFLAKGGRIERVGYQMKDLQPWVINPKRTPVYSHLFQRPDPIPQAQPTPEPETVLEVIPVPAVLPTPARPQAKRRAADVPAAQLAARLMVQAALGGIAGGRRQGGRHHRERRAPSGTRLPHHIQAPTLGGNAMAQHTLTITDEDDGLTIKLASTATLNSTPAGTVVTSLLGVLAEAVATARSAAGECPCPKCKARREAESEAVPVPNKRTLH